jgi:hypothetical protein
MRCLIASLEDLPAVHAQHKQRTVDHVARLATNVTTMPGLQSNRSVPLLAGHA